jgi:hypothetical protein
MAEAVQDGLEQENLCRADQILLLLEWASRGVGMIADGLIRQFDKPDDVREFPLGRFEIVHLAGASFGRATYQPGWKWSLYNAPIAGTALCHAPHIGVAISGHGVVQYEDGTKIDLLPGTVFHITDQPHDSWVEGDTPYVSIHLLK